MSKTVRRFHPNGHTIYDVYQDGRRLGAVTHPDAWHVYLGFSDDEIGTARTQKEAIAMLIEASRG